MRATDSHRTAAMGAKAPVAAGSLEPEPVACVTRGGPTPFHPEPGRETSQRRGYWRCNRWESRSVRPTSGHQSPGRSGSDPIAAWSSGSSSGS
jgi:hypothetical protein